jgi:hypothetical protein
MKQIWTSTKDSLPPEGIYVLVHLNKNNWGDSSDQEGVYFKTAKLTKGISEQDRKDMEKNLLPNPLERFYGGGSARRSEVYKNCDQHANNRVPYCWNGFGTDYFFGQEVDYWMPIPAIPKV